MLSGGDLWEYGDMAIAVCLKGLFKVENRDVLFVSFQVDGVTKAECANDTQLGFFPHAFEALDMFIAPFGTRKEWCM